MSDDQPSPTPDLERIALAGASAVERFAQENKEIDRAWAAGRLQEYISAQVQQALDGNR